MRKAALVLCLLLAACSGDAEPSARTPAEATPEPDYPCPNQEAVIDDVSLRSGNPEGGDVDGDGEDDTVSIYFDPQGEVGCQGFVVAETAAGVLSGPLETWRGEYGLPMPTLNTTGDVDGEPGDEVVVNMGGGASTQFVGIVVEDGGALRQVTTALDTQAVAGMFGFGGSVGHLEAVDCAPGGGVVVAYAAPDGNRYDVQRTFYRFSGTELIEEDQEVRRGLPVERIQRLPEYAASPFGSCS